MNREMNDFNLCSAGRTSTGKGRIVMISTLLVLASQLPVLCFAGKADYHDVDEFNTAIDALDGGALGRMTVHFIGTSEEGRPIRALHLAALGPGGEQFPDNPHKPALLIEGGIHAREWASAELCLLFLQAFHLAVLFDPVRIDDILANADIWVIPMLNPDGRAMDDAAHGDPENFWSSKLYHDNDDSDLSGWRDNTSVVACGHFSSGFTKGIDLNRSFSAGWDDPASGADEWLCNDNNYHGEVPFQAREANVLRKFVNNRMISMSLHVHAYKGCVGNRNGYVDIAANFHDVWNAAVPSELTLTLTSSSSPCTGGGYGQSTAWMADPSDTPFESDHSTKRSIKTILLELPPHSSSEYNDPAYPYRWSPSDGSNAFHPSSDHFVPDALNGFYEALMYLAEQARSPWCPLDPATLMPDPSYVRDFGLTGSKIANCKKCVGSLTFHYTGSGADEYMQPGDRKVVYRVQNFDYTTGTIERARVTVVISSRPAWPDHYVTDLIDTQYFDLGPGMAVTGQVTFTFAAERDYMVDIHSTPVTFSGDTQPDNDEHLFRFRTFGNPPSAVTERMRPSIEPNLQVVPNPCNPRTTIHFDLPREAQVSVCVFDLQGKLVTQLTDEVLSAGSHSIPWDGKDGCGHAVSTGLYLVQLRGGGRESHQKVLLLR